jgi:hypothetical protein
MLSVESSFVSVPDDESVSLGCEGCSPFIFGVFIDLLLRTDDRVIIV